MAPAGQGVSKLDLSRSLAVLTGVKFENRRSTDRSCDDNFFFFFSLPREEVNKKNRRGNFVFVILVPEYFE